jgi:hypothetical protein
MRPVHALLVGLGLFSGLPGCAGSRWQPDLPGSSNVSGLASAKKRPPLTPLQRVALEQARKCSCLDIWTIDELIADQSQWVDSLLAQLTQVGARLDQAGTLRDGKGKEIRIWAWPPGPGCQMFPEQLEALRKETQRQLDELRRQYTVLEVAYIGPQPP